MINIRQKGFNGEREIATMLNALLMTVMRELGFPEATVIESATTIQRNQNQSAVGGADLSNTFGLAIEIKRHENTSGLNGWWAQVVAAAERNSEVPVLIFRQNNQKWRVITWGSLPLPIDGPQAKVRVEFSYADFQAWFKVWVGLKIRQGESVRT